MDTSNESPQEQKVTSIVDNAIKQTEAKKEAINHLPSDKGPLPTSPGEGVFARKQPGDKKVKEASLKKDIAGIRENTLNDTAKTIEGSPVNTQAKAYKIADDFAYPQTARQNDPALKRGAPKGLDETQRSAMHQMGHTDMKERGAKSKDISESQDYGMRKLGDEKEKKSPPSQQKENNQFKGASMSQKFSSTLGYSKLNKSLGNQPGSKETKQPISMSGKFSATLGYNNMNQSNNGSSPTKGTKSKGLGKDV